MLKSFLNQPGGGFTIDLDTRLSEYIPKGFRLFLRNPNETVITNRGGILLSPGRETFLKIEKKTVKGIVMWDHSGKSWQVG